MALTHNEQKELVWLEEITPASYPMSRDQIDRRKYLRKKFWHNSCSNPHCTGHNGTDEEKECPKCGSKLFKKL